MGNYNLFYIFEITEVEDSNYGELISVEATPINFEQRIDGRYVKSISEMKKDRFYFFYPKTGRYVNEIINIAKENRGEWEVNIDEFNCKFIELDGRQTTAYYYKSLQGRKNIWKLIKSLFKK